MLLNSMLDSLGLQEMFNMDRFAMHGNSECENRQRIRTASRKEGERSKVGIKSRMINYSSGLPTLWSRYSQKQWMN